MVFKKAVKLQSNDKIATFHNVTAEAKAAVAESGIKNGICVIKSHGSFGVPADSGNGFFCRFACGGQHEIV